MLAPGLCWAMTARSKSARDPDCPDLGRHTAARCHRTGPLDGPAHRADDRNLGKIAGCMLVARPLSSPIDGECCTNMYSNSMGGWAGAALLGVRVACGWPSVLELCSILFLAYDIMTLA